MSTDHPESAGVEDEEFLDDDGVLYDDDVTPEPGILGFTLRELLIVAVWAVAFIVSFFPIVTGEALWAQGIQWILPIGVPTAAVFLIVLRRFSPDGIRRVGSLGIDQFASVAFSVSAVTWLGALWAAVAASIEFGVWTLNWVGVVELLASLALVALTVFAPLIPRLKEDFHGRLVTLAHRNANPVRPVVSRPRATASAAVDEASDRDAAPAGDTAAFAEHDLSGGAVQTPPAARMPETDDAVTALFLTDEVARLDLPDRVPLSAHASGGGTGTENAVTDPATPSADAPQYSRRSRSEEILSTTGEIESFLGQHGFDDPARAEAGAEAGEPLVDDREPDPYQVPVDDGSPVVDRSGGSDAFPPPAAQPFWILAATERAVHDERGEPIFVIGPNAWALVIEDRGGAFVVRHDDGRIGYLHDISDITKG